MQVGPALLIEYTAPAAVVGWLWLRHGQRPGPVTLAGAALAALGLVLVLDLVSGADLSLVGVLWALAAMVGAARTSSSPPTRTTACRRSCWPPAGCWSARVGPRPARPGRAAAAATPTARRRTPAPTVAWWLPLLVLGVVTAALAYATGIAAGRRLGSRLASFVALLEVVAGVLFAWLLLGELPRPSSCSAAC